MHNIHPPWGGISFELEEVPCVHMQPPIHSSHFFVIIWPWPPIPCIDQSTYKMNAFEKYGKQILEQIPGQPSTNQMHSNNWGST